MLSKPGVLGPNIKPHPEGAKCSTHEGASVGDAPDESTPPLPVCGITWDHLPGGVVHVRITNTSIANAVGSLATFDVDGLGKRPIMNATGLSGKYDLTLEFRSDSNSSLIDPDADDGGVPTLIGALKQQLGIRVETDRGGENGDCRSHLRADAELMFSRNDYAFTSASTSARAFTSPRFA